MSSGLWPSPWSSEDGGPNRLQTVVSPRGWDLRPGQGLEVTHREAPGTTMVVLREPGEVYVLRHGFGDDAPAWVEQIDPVTLEVRLRSPDLAGGPMWPGGLAAHADGTLHVVFGNHVFTTAEVSLTEVCGLPGGLIANPPLVDASRRIVVGYDSGNGVMTAFDVGLDGALRERWRRQQDHAGHMLLFSHAGQLVSGDHDRERMADQVVVLDIETGAEVARADTGSPLQAVVFPSLGWDDDVYVCSMSTLTRVCPAARA